MFKNGFTLIELLIVVLIIAILAAIAVPNFLEFQARAKVARCKSDLRNAATAVEAYVVENERASFDSNDGIDGGCGSGAGYTDGFPNTIAVEIPGYALDAIDPSNSFPTTGGRFRFRTHCVWKRMTTPVQFISSAPLDGFSVALPLHYETFEAPNGGVAFVTMQCMAPDKVLGSLGNFDTWPPPPGGSSPAQTVGTTAQGTINTCTHNPIYDPTNGTISCGELYRIAALFNTQTLLSRVGPYFARITTAE